MRRPAADRTDPQINITDKEVLVPFQKGSVSVLPVYMGQKV